MFRFEDSAEEVARGGRQAEITARRGRSFAGTVVRPARAKSRRKNAAKALRPRDPLGPDAKNYNDEIPDPDLVVPE